MKSAAQGRIERPCPNPEPHDAHEWDFIRWCPGVSAATFSPGQVWRSLRLRDYRVKLVRPIGHGTWIVEPSGSSGHGSYTVNEDALRDPTRYVEEDVT